MKRIYKQIGVAFTSLVLVLGTVAAGYHISKLPEKTLLGRVNLPQGNLGAYESFEEADEVLTQLEELVLKHDVTFGSGEEAFTLRMTDLGFKLDAQGAHEYLAGFNETSAWDRIKLFFLGKSLDFALELDVEQTHQALLPHGVEFEAANASFIYEDGALVIQKETEGQLLDEDSFDKLFAGPWLEDFTLLEAAELPFLSQEPEVLASDLEQIQDDLAPILAETLTLIDSETSKSWNLALSDHLNWFMPGANGLALNATAVEASVDEVVAIELEQEPQNVTIIEQEDGSYDFEGSARFGKEISQTVLFTAIEEALFDPEVSLEINLPIDEIQPEITVPDSLAELNVTDLLSVGHTTFYGSPANRVHNIGVGMGKFNGVIVHPGEEFVFNDLMGDITPAEGWRAELVIKGDETIPEYGGGLCQVSTTAYRAALFSGLPITQRKNHSYAVSYYSQILGHGLDATIYDPAPVMSFLNDTEAPILVQSYADGYEAYFVFYGKDDGRSVEMDGPYSYGYWSVGEPQITYTDELAPGQRILEEYAHTGFKVDWYRTITYGDGTIGETENIHSDYRATPAKYLEGRSEEAAAEGIGG